MQSRRKWFYASALASMPVLLAGILAAGPTASQAAVPASGQLAQVAPLAPAFESRARGAYLRDNVDAPLTAPGYAEALAGSTGKVNVPPPFGADVQMDPTTAPYQQNEFQLDINPTDPNYAVGGANTYASPNFTGYFRTTNGGTTWADGVFTSAFPDCAACNHNGDPAVRYDGNGTVYFSELGFDSTQTQGGVYVLTSTNNAQTWSAPRKITGNTAVIFQDRNNITADRSNGPLRGRIYSTNTEFDDVSGKIAVLRSDDKGGTWLGPVYASGLDRGSTQSSKPVVGANSTLYVGYQYYPSDNQLEAYNMVARSNDGGLTFTNYTITNQMITQGGVQDASSGRMYFCTTVNGAASRFRHRGHPVVGASPTDPNTIYAVWTDGRFETPLTCPAMPGQTGLHSDIVFSKSTNGGATWTTPVRVNDDGIQGRDQFFPWLEVSSDGVVHVAWLDRRNDPNDLTMDKYYAQSTDGGSTWSANQRVSDRSSLPFSFIGDYEGLGVYPSKALPMWWDSRLKQRGDPFTDAGGGAGATNTPTAVVTNTATRTPAPGTATATPCAYTASWQDRAPLPAIRGRAVGATIGNNVYVFGGRSSNTVFEQTIYKYDTVANTWSTIPTTLPFTTTANMAAGVLTFPEGQRIVLVGGSGPGSVLSNATRAFNPADNTFTTKAPWPATPLRLPGGWAVANNKFYIFGGFNSAAGLVFADIWVYDPMTDNWALNSAQLGMPRAYIATETMPDGMIYLAGGSQIDSAGTLTDETIFEKFNTATNTIALGPALPSPKSNAHGYSVGGKFVVPGGNIVVDSQDTLIYDPGSNTWSMGPQTLHIARNYAKGYGPNNSIHMLGGINAASDSYFNWNQKLTLQSQCASPTPTASPTPCPINFSDVHPSDWFYEYVRCLYCRGAISGYSDGTFRPYANATRGQMTKIVVLAFGYPIYTPATPTFSDVPPTNPFYQYIETAAHNNIVSGYSDGTFRWYADVTRGQLSKITVIAAGWATINPVTPTFTDVPRENPFYTYIETAACHQIVNGYSDGTFRPYANATRAQISKIVCLAVRNAAVCSQPPAATPTAAAAPDRSGSRDQ